MDRFQKWFLLILCFSLLTAFWTGSCAEVVGRTQDGYIHRYAAENGQEIYFVSALEEPDIDASSDVNFDGHPDLCVVTILGASNAYFEFFLWQDGQYVYADQQCGPVINYSLERGKYLVSRSHDGSAGLLFHAQICQWDGPVLRAVRTMVSEEETVTTYADSVITTTVDSARLQVTLRDIDPETGEARTIWETVYDSFPESVDEFDLLMARLWDGLD